MDGTIQVEKIHCVKSVQIWDFFRIEENTAQKNSVFGHFSRKDPLCENVSNKVHCLIAG